MAAGPPLGLGPNDPNANRRRAGTPYGTQNPSSIGGLSFSKQDVDTSGLTDISQKFGKIIADVTKLDTVLSKLQGTVSKVGQSLGGLVGLRGGQGGLSAAGGAGSTVTAAGVTAFGGGGTRGGTTTPASFSGGTGGGGGVGKMVALGGLAEIGSQWAGTINTKMAGFQQGGVGLDLQARQLAGGFGQNPASIGQVTSQMTQTPALSQSDLQQAYGIIMSNPYLRATPGSKNARGLQRFMSAATGLNPAMGATGAANFANVLTSPAMQQALTRFGLGQQGKGLFNPMTGKISGNPNQVFSSILDVLMGGQRVTSKQARALAANPEKWAALQQNASAMGLNLSSADMGELWQFAGSGMNLSKAQGEVGGSVASSLLGLGTAKTQAGQAAFQGTAGTQSQINRIKAQAYGIGRDIAQSPVGGAALSIADALGQAGSTILKVVSGGAQLGVVGRAIRTLRGGQGGVSGAPAGSPAGPAAPTGSSTQPLYVRTEPGQMFTVTIAADSIKDLCGCTMAGKTPPKRKPSGGGGGGGGMSLWDHIVGKNDPTGAWGQLYHNTLKDLPLLGLFMGDPIDQMGDPPTGATSTTGLSPQLAGRVSAMMAANPNLQITSGKRSSAQQKALYTLKGGRGVAKPGNSQHERGAAVDMGPPSQFGWISKNAGKFGLGTPAPRSEPWHLQAMGDPVTGSSVVSAAEKWIGTPYQWGGTGTTPGQGVDCSRFVQEVYASLGISLPRTTYEQCQMGTAVGGIGSAQPGDLIFFDYEGPNSHVAIFVGGGKQIAAPETGQTVQIQPVDTGHITQIRRIVSGGAGKAVAQAASNAVGSSSSSPKTSGGGGAGGTNVGLVNSFIERVGSLGGLFGIGAVNSGHTASSTSSASTSSAAAPSSSAAAGAGAAPPTAGQMSASQVYQLAIGAGLSATAARTATAVAKVESGFNPQAIDNDSNGSADYGLWQINSINGGSSALYDAAKNAAKMAAMTNKGQAWAPWGPDFGESGYSTNPPLGGLAGSKVAQALATLGTLGDPVGTTFSPSMRGAGSGGTAGFGFSGSGGQGRSITVNMPLQVVGVSAQDAQMLANQVLAIIKQAGGTSSVAEN